MTGADPSDERAEDEPPPPAQQAGVLGNLPKTRPQVRSPRRKGRSQAAASTARQKRSEAPRPADRKPRPERTGDEPMAAREPQAPAGLPDLEAVARGGLQIAGEAASLGLRIAGRAAAAIRDSVERR